MTETKEVAPTAETEESNIVSIADIMEASGVESFIEKSPIEEEEGAEEVAEYSETEPEPKPEIEVEPETEVSQDSDGVKKRIGKLIEAKNQAEAEKQALEEELRDMKKAPQKGLDQFDQVQTFDELKKRESDAEHLRDWLLENPDGGEYTDESGETHDVDSQVARKLTAQTDRDLRKNIPEVAKRLQLKQQNSGIALSTFEWMKDDGSPEKVEMNKIISNNPQIKKYVENDPYGMITLGYAVEGYKAIMAKKSGGANKAVAPKMPSAPTRANPSVVRGKSSTKSKLLAKASSGDIGDASSYIETLL
jgi:hypothetical protein